LNNNKSGISDPIIKQGLTLDLLTHWNQRSYIIFYIGKPCYDSQFLKMLNLCLSKHRNCSLFSLTKTFLPQIFLTATSQLYFWPVSRPHADFPTFAAATHNFTHLHSQQYPLQPANHTAPKNLHQVWTIIDYVITCGL
jgi:hypothetical protein